MKFEYLIWIVIFLIYVLLFILKRMRAASKTGDKGSLRPGWKEKLDEFLSKARQGMKSAKQDGLKMKTGWERFLPQKDYDPEPLRDEMSAEKVSRAKEKTPFPKIRPAPVEAVAKSLEPVVSGKKIPPIDLEYGIEDLRKAVIWSEILAPPLALRDR
ncbi:MAG: hypothetical protein JRJ04_16145 [Deltaproteobacteria bacterium]|nr:hypothetical protein [Deltaproteobacteria bacterium]